MRNFSLVSVAVALGLLVMAGSASAMVMGPYSVDSDTLHLWHMEETTGAYLDSVTTGPGPIDLAYIGAGVTRGTSTYSGFGVSVTGGSEFLSVNADGTDHLDLQSLYQGTDGAFTWEAMIKLVAWPTSSFQPVFSRYTNISGSLLSKFELHSSGKLIFWGWNNGTVQGSIPTAGADAFVADEWFHVAVTFDGTANTDAMKLYWTRVREEATEASLLTSGSFTAFDGTKLSETGVGESDLSTNGHSDPLNGSIDEFRVSGKARGAGDMIFGVPEPSSFVLVAMGLFGLLAYAWRKRK